MGSPGQLQPGAQVWIKAQELIWKQAVVSSISKDTVAVVLQDSTSRTLHLRDVEPANTENVSACTDITQLTHLNEPSILEFLLARYGNDDIYTSAGPVLVAINPCRQLPNLFTEELRKQYQDGSEDKPHIYNVVASAYLGMMREGSHQALVISGESGAGKTESTKMALDYFATLSGGTGISNAILQSNPILEAFGNAKTTRNPNSSRFGKLLQVHFSPASDGISRHLSSASIQTYLLEKSRVVGPGAGERNYHVFSMLLRGATPEEKQAWHLPAGGQAATEFCYLSKGVQDAEGRDDAEDWREMREAMTAVGLSQAEQHQLFSAVAGVLWLGNIAFLPSDRDDSCCVHPDSGDALSKAASLLGVSDSELTTALTTRQLRAGGEVLRKSLRQAEARVARDSLAKGMYSAMFDWLVSRINLQLNADQPPGVKDTSISVLDIFGFEQFKVNSFEQLCINYANERLQQLFCRHLFQHEQAEYQREGLRWALHSYSDNAHVVALLDSPAQPLGVLKLLDDQCLQPGGGSDSNFLESLRKEHGLVKGKAATGSGLSLPSRPPGTFDVQHFAGQVGYSVESMVTKNMDDLSEDLKQLMAGSSSALLAALGRTLLSDSTTSRGRKKSVAGMFGQQMNRLVSTLQLAQLHFVRCVKPNPTLRPGDPEASMVLDQIRCAGVVEVGRIFKEGYPTRYPIALFLQRFNISLKGLDLLAPLPPPSPHPPSTSSFTSLPTPVHPQSPSSSTKPQSGNATPSASASTATPPASPNPSPSPSSLPPSNPRAQADLILQQRFQLQPGEHYALGKTKIFFRAGVLGGVEAEMQRLAKLSLQVQGCATFWKDYARTQPLKRRFLELARGHKQWLAEQARLKVLEEQRRCLEAERAAAEAAARAASDAAAEELREQEEERAAAEEAERVRVALEEEKKQGRLRVQRLWEERVATEKQATVKLAAQMEVEREARHRLEEEAEVEREARRKLEEQAEAEREARQKAEEEAEAAKAELELRKAALDLEMRAREEEVQRREREAEELRRREEGLRAKEAELDALLAAQRQRLAEHLGPGGGGTGDVTQVLGRSRSRRQVESQLQDQQTADLLQESTERRKAQASDRVRTALQAILLTSRLRSHISQTASSPPPSSPPSSPPSTAPIPIDPFADIDLSLGAPPAPPRISSINLDDVPIDFSPLSPLPSTSSELGSPWTRSGTGASMAAAPSGDFGAPPRELPSGFQEAERILTAISAGAAASHPLAGDLVELIHEAVGGMATLDEDVRWLEGVKAGRVQASAVLQLRPAEIRMEANLDHLLHTVKEDAKEIRAQLKKAPGGSGQEVAAQLQAFERLFSRWNRKFETSFRHAKHMRDTRLPQDRPEESLSSVRTRNPLKKLLKGFGQP